MGEIATSTLAVQRRLREGSRRGGVTIAKRVFSDFVVDGVSLLDRVGGDYMSCFLQGSKQQSVAARDELIGANPDKPVRLYICPECGDLGCGAVLTRVIRQDDHVVWSALTWDNGLSDRVYDDLRGAFADRKLGPFRFERAAYEAAILAASRI